MDDTGMTQRQPPKCHGRDTVPSTVLNYGGGRQTVAICVLIERRMLPLPDLILMADTGRENPTTWAYLAEHVQPMLAKLGRQVTVIPREEPPALTYGADDKPLIPVFSRDANGKDGKMASFCTGTWKRDRMVSWLKANKISKGERWIGYSVDEKRRIKRFLRSERQDGWQYRFPLNELMIDKPQCIAIVKERFGVEPPISSCWMCPHKRNDEWRAIRESPELWAAVCDMDDEMREQDLFRGGGGVWLHHSRVPLREADLDAEESADLVRQCSLGMCFI